MQGSGGVQRFIIHVNIVLADFHIFTQEILALKYSIKYITLSPLMHFRSFSRETTEMWKHVLIYLITPLIWFPLSF